MATPIAKKTRKRFRQGAKTVEKSFKNLRSGHKKSVNKASVVAGTGVLVAAGVAVAALALRKEAHDGVTFHVDLDSDGAWALRADGSGKPIETFRTKAIAVRAARKAAADAAPSDLMIHMSDGTVQATHSYHPH
jgi:hypothetical protein